MRNDHDRGSAAPCEIHEHVEDAAGVPAVEFGPVGEGHHGPSEWVSISSLRSYRQALESYVANFPSLIPATDEKVTQQ